jgi:hypothetical protein
LSGGRILINAAGVYCKQTKHAYKQIPKKGGYKGWHILQLSYRINKVNAIDGAIVEFLNQPRLSSDGSVEISVFIQQVSMKIRRFESNRRGSGIKKSHPTGYRIFNCSGQQ